MGLFDRLRNVVPAPSIHGSLNTEAAEFEATRQLGEGIANENAGRLQEALANYDAAIRLKPDLGRGHFNRGNVLLELDDPQGAVDAYASALVYKPDSAAAFYNMGNAHARLGQSEHAITAYQKAITLNPDFTDAFVALGTVLQSLKRTDEAITAYRQALAFRPDYAETYYNLGSTFAEAGKFEEAAINFRLALAIRQDYAEAHYNLGNVLMESGQLDEAVISYHQAIELRPTYVNAHNNLGATYKKLGQNDAAIASYRRALEIAPDMAELHNNLGVALKSMGRLGDAEASYRLALKINPDFVEVLSNIGAIQHQLGQIDEALASYHRALELDPGCADACNNLGIVQQQIGQTEAALASYRRVLEIEPDHVASHNNLGAALVDLGCLEEAFASYRQALTLKPDYTDAHSNLICIHNYLADHSSTQLLAETRRFGDIVARQADTFTYWDNTPEPNRCLRIGIVSADLRQHPVGYFSENVLAMLTTHALGRLEVFAYSNNFQFDATSERIKACCKTWRFVPNISDEMLAKLIRDDAVDILIDLSGHTDRNRLPLFAWKPAPVQITWLGYFASTGVEAIDYLLADPWTLPESEETNFTETIWRLPETRLCFTPPDVTLNVGPLPALDNGYVTFGCFNHLTKMNEGVVALWARILTAIPKSRLFLKTRHLEAVSAQQSVIKRFESRGINAGRLILESYAPRADYLAAYNRIDIALDPFPYTGGTTSVEALWMGVPVLTLEGRQFLARQGVGLLMNAGLPEWVAADQDDYLSRAVAHASDLQRLASLRAGLRQQVLASPIFDAPRFARHFEAALRGMWKKWCDDQGARAPEQTPVSSAK